MPRDVAVAVGLLSGDALETATVVGELRLPRVGYDDEYRPLAGSYGGALCGNQPLVWGVPTKLQNSLSRSNRSRFG